MFFVDDIARVYYNINIRRCGVTMNKNFRKMFFCMSVLVYNVSGYVQSLHTPAAMRAQSNYNNVSIPADIDQSKLQPGWWKKINSKHGYISIALFMGGILLCMISGLLGAMCIICGIVYCAFMVYRTEIASLFSIGWKSLR